MNHCLRYIRISLAVVIGLFTPLLFAAPTIEDYGRLPTIDMVALSPSGDLFAYRKTDGEKDLFVVYSRKTKNIIAAADIGELTPKGLYFLSENEVIIRVSQFKDYAEVIGEHEFSSAYVFNIKNKEFKQLLKPGDNIRFAQTGLGRIVGIAPDKKSVFMPAFVDEDANDATPNLSLMNVNLAKPARPKVHHKGNNKTTDYFMDNQGNIVAKEIYSDSNNKHSIVVPDGKDWKEIFNDNAEIMTIGFVGLTPDFKSLVVLNTNKQTGHTAYHLMSLADGSFTDTDFGRTDADILTVLTDLNRIVYGVIYSGFNPSYKFFNADTNKHMADVLQKFPGQSVWLQDWTPDWKTFLVHVEGSDNAGEYFLFSQNEAPVRLGSSRPNITQQDVNPIATVNIKARDGFIIPTLLTLPITQLDNPKNLPTVLLPHGGPHAYDTIGFNWIAQAFANRDYLVIQPQFRGSSGFGSAHYDAGKGEWGKKMQDDLTDSVKFLIEKGYVNPNKVCVVGLSYGGYAALAGGAFTPDMYQCVVSVNGVSDLRNMLSTEKRTHGKSSWVVSYWEDSMAKGNASADTLKSISPAYHADNFKAPVLLLHGEKDKTVPMLQSKIMYKKLKGADKTVVFKPLKNETHHLVSGATRLEMLNEMLSFVDQYIGQPAR